MGLLVAVFRQIEVRKGKGKKKQVTRPFGGAISEQEVPKHHTGPATHAEHWEHAIETKKSRCKSEAIKTSSNSKICRGGNQARKPEIQTRIPSLLARFHISDTVR